MATTTWAWLVLLFPLLGTLADRLSASARARPRTPAGSAPPRSLLAFAAAVGALIRLQGHAPESPRSWSPRCGTTRSRSASTSKLSILVDPLSVFMILIVTGVSTMIHLYSVAYMDRDRGYARYFAYLNFFVFSMLLLVLGRQLRAADRRLGVRRRRLLPADLLLVPAHDGHRGRHQGVRDQRRRRRRPRARHLLHLQAHRTRSTTCRPSTRSNAALRPAGNDGDLVAGCLLLLVGAFAKSAQIPLHTWLPDAMEGPTPVSALIHAATMVTAGVYLIARMHPLFELAPAAQDVGAVDRRADAADRRHDRARPDRHQARDRLLDDVADRLHDHGRLGGRLRGRRCST